MGRQVAIAAYVAAMVAVVVVVDILFFRHHASERLIANIAIVLVFGAGAALGSKFLKRPQQ